MAVPTPIEPHDGPDPPDVSAVVDALLAEERQAELKADVVHRVTLPSEPARRVAVGEVEPALPPEVVAGLAKRGIEELFSHQARGWEAVSRGEDVLVTTPTASGKSLVFHLPPLVEAVEAARGGDQKMGKALYLFPLKALGQDQRAKFDQLAESCGLPPELARAEIYDGDTPGALRAKIKKDPPRVLVTNPDMLHMGVLGAWTGWAEMLENLRWIVLDELHTYRGIFGSHFHHVLRRFLRLAREAGANPQIIASSATAGNAVEFAEILTGRRFTHMGESGAPRAARHMVLVDPWASPYTTALALFTRLVEAGLKTIVFTKARRVTELMVSWLRRQNPELARRVRSYRSGFLPEERRSIEKRLFSGELDGVISTSALEMGIDVGGLDACILVGYPGSMMATWQRSGRAGRGSRESLTALVALPDALDQYFLTHPDEFLERPCERLIVDPGNRPVSRAHLVCAAAELSLTATRDGTGGDGYLDRYGELVESMVEDQVLVRSGDGSELYSFQRRPHGRVSLRGSGQSYEIVDGTTGELVGTIDGVRVLHECHPGAVYLHGGRQYLVETLDQDHRHVVATPTDVEYFTTPLTEKETEILEVSASREPSDEVPLAAHLARVRVTERVVGFERKQIGSQELLSQHPLDELPPNVFETVGVLWVAPQAFEDHLRRSEEHWLGALHATEHTAISLVPLLALCDRGDIGGISYPRHPQVGAGAVFVYDGHPGGVGIAERVFAELPELLARVLSLLDACLCDSGCPSCVQSPKCGNGNRPLDKSGARRVLRLLLGQEQVEGGVEHPRLTLELDDDARAALVPPERRARPVPTPEPTPEPEEPSPPLVLVPEPRPEAAPETAGESITVLFDIETLRSAREVGGWNNPHKMGVALAVALVLEEGRFEVYDESRVEELVALLERARLVVGYNIRRFDYGVLSGYTGVDYRRTLPTLDLLDDVRRASGARVGLDHLARETLGDGQGKSGDGLQCLEWVQEGRMDLVESYCRRDVEVMRDVYLHGRREGFVRLQHRKRGRIDVPVDW